MANPKSELDVVIKGKDELSPSLTKLETNIIRAVGAISAALAGIRIAAAPITAAATFERELAEIAKTTGFTTTQIDKLGASLLNLSMRIDVSATDLAKIAAAAGQQGLGREGTAGVLQFTESVSRMASVLDLTAEDAANNVGKIANIFKIPLADIERAVSTFNEVSNNSTASGEELLDVVRRIGDAAGSLDLQQATALAATGLDFGQSPEVVGTAYAKVFSSMFEKADEFAALMGTSATKWLDILQNDGIDAYKRFLDQLRKLDAQSRQKAIVDLVGGGRIGALINKQVQDAQNTVLNRNLASADQGALGTSALKEQATVLETLVAQTKILSNSFFKLGADASQQLLEPLTAYAAQLSEALQAEGTKAAIAEIMGAVKDLVDTIVEAIQFVASLNINWSNFIQLAKVFAGVKLAQSIGAMVAGFTGLNRILKSTSKDAEEAAKAVTATGQAADKSAKASIASWAAQKAGVAEAITVYKQRKAAIDAEAAALKSRDAAQASSTAAAAALARQQAKAATLTGLEDSAGNKARAQRQAVVRAEQQAAQARIQAQNQAAARVQQAEAANAAALAQIQQNYQNRYNAIRATGTEVGLKAARAERAQQIADQEAYHQRSLRSIQAYQARRIAAVEATGQAEIQAERALLMQRLAVYDAVTNKINSQKNVTGVAQTAAASAANGLAQAEKNLTAATAAANIARGVWTGLGVAIRTVAGVISAAASAFLSIAGWVTLIYSLADAFGLVEKAAPYFTKLTDAIGLTSKAMRDKEVANRAEEAALREQIKLLDEATKKYREYTDARTGQINTTRLGQDAALAGNEAANEDVRLGGLTNINQVLSGIKAQEDALKKAMADGANNLVAEQQRIIADAQAEIAKLGAERIATTARFPNQAQEIAQGYAAQIADVQKRIDEATKKIEGFDRGIAASGESVQKLRDDFRSAAEVAATLFTPGSAKILQEEILKIAQSRDAAKKATDELTKAEQESFKTNKGDTRNAEQVEADLKRKQAQLLAIEEQNKETARLEAEVRKLINAQLAVPGLDPKVAQSYRDLFTFMQQPLSAIENLVRATREVDVSKLTGANTGVGGNPATTGKNTYTETAGQESAARRLEKARLALARARIQAENALADERAKQLLAKEEDFYNQGLTGLQQYYESRKKIELAANARDIADRERELEEAEKSAKRSKGADAVLFEAQAVKLRGDINVLQEQRSAIIDQNAIALREATTQFQNKIREETGEAMREGLIPATTQEIFQNSLDSMAADYEVFLNQLVTKGDEASLRLAEALRNGFKLQSIDQALTPITNTMSRIYAEIGRVQQRAELQRQDGILTSQQAEAAYTAEIQKRIPILREQIELAQRQVEALKGLENTEGYKRQAAAIEDMKVQLEQLAAATNQTAKAVNENVTASIAGAIGELRKYGASAKEVFLNLLLSISDSILQIFERQFAERIMQSIGSGGAEGIGAWIQEALQGTATQSTPAVGAAGKAASAITDISKPDGSIAKPFYTISAEDLIPGEEEDGLMDGIIDAIAGGAAGEDGEGEEGGVVDAVMALGSTFTSGLDGLGGALSSGFGEIVSTIFQVIQSLMTFLAAQQAAETTGDAVSSVASVAHSGGKVGTSPLRKRRVNPMIFAGAHRFHNGLAPDEIPAILQTGERVLNRQQNAAYEKGMNQGQDVSIRNVLVVDPNFVPDSMNSSQGERVVMTMLEKNKAAIKQMVNS